jgi:hypothetical protein
MAELTMGVNWLAVIVGAALAFALGMVWFSPRLFGAKWAEGVGRKLTEGAKPPMNAKVLQAVGTLGLAWLTGITAVHNALLTIILIALTIMALMAGGGYFSGKSTYAVAAEAGYVAAMVIIMIIVQGIS